MLAGIDQTKERALCFSKGTKASDPPTSVALSAQGNIPQIGKLGLAARQRPASLGCTDPGARSPSLKAAGSCLSGGKVARWPFGWL